jgi:DNA-binding response OmpR family regulator
VLSASAVTAPQRKILLIEDEPHIVLGLTDALEFEGFQVISAARGGDGVAAAKQHRPDAIVLDLMLPDTNGFRVCEELRRWDGAVPILMLTARSQEADKIRGLDAGADDYVTKPFSVGELTARVRALVRRAHRLETPAIDSFLVGSARVHLAAQTVVLEGMESPLSFYEVELLRLLRDRAGQPVSRDEILQRVWGVGASPSNRTVDNFIVKLRRKIEPAPDQPRHILTVYGTGYKLVP